MAYCITKSKSHYCEQTNNIFHCFSSIIFKFFCNIILHNTAFCVNVRLGRGIQLSLEALVGGISQPRLYLKLLWEGFPNPDCKGFCSSNRG